MSSFPVFDGKLLTLLFADFTKVLLKIWEGCVPIWYHIHDGEDYLISESSFEKHFIDLCSSANESLSISVGDEVVGEFIEGMDQGDTWKFEW